MTRIQSHTLDDAPIGWDSEQLAKAFSSMALNVFTGSFLNYAQTPLGLPSISAAAARQE